MSHQPGCNLKNHLTPTECVGLLLTGGTSQRFGRNKLTQPLGRQSVVQFAAQALTTTCRTTFEVGAGLTDLPQIPDSMGRGPLAAIAQAVTYLRANGILKSHQCALVLAGDVPLISSSTLAIIAHWPGNSSVIPVVNGREQYLAARWSPQCLDNSVTFAKRGSLKIKNALDAPKTQYLSLNKWNNDRNFEFLDVDTPDQISKVTDALRTITERRPQS